MPRHPYLTVGWRLSSANFLPAASTPRPHNKICLADGQKDMPQSPLRRQRFCGNVGGATLLKSVPSSESVASFPRTANALRRVSYAGLGRYCICHTTQISTRGSEQPVSVVNTCSIIVVFVVFLVDVVRAHRINRTLRAVSKRKVQKKVQITCVCWFGVGRVRHSGVVVVSWCASCA